MRGVSDEEANIQSCHCCDGDPHVAYPSGSLVVYFLFLVASWTADGSQTMFGRTEDYPHPNGEKNTIKTKCCCEAKNYKEVETRL